MVLASPTSIVLSPFARLFLGAIFMFVVSLLLAKARRWTWFRRLQFVSAGLYSLGHRATMPKNHGYHRRAAFSAGLLGPEFHHPLDSAGMSRGWPWAPSSADGALLRPWA